MLLSRRITTGLIVLWLLMVTLPQIARAAEWAMEPSVSVRGDYNTNLTLTDAPHDEVWGHWVSPGVKFKGSTENLEVDGSIRGDFVRYYGGKEVGFTNMFFPVSARYKTELDIWGLEGSFTRDNTLMGELIQTGVVLSFTQRNLWTVNPTWTRTLTEKLSLHSGYQFSDASYQDGLRLNLVDYQVHVGNTGFAYKLTEKDELQVGGLYANFHVPDVGLRSTFYGGQLTITHLFSETLTAALTGGPRRVSSTLHLESSALTDSQTVWVFNATVSKQLEDMRFQLEVAREINPSGFGLLLQTDRFAVSVAKDLTETLTASVNAQFLSASSIASKAATFVFPENRYINVSPSLSWKISEWWSLAVAYTYAQRDVESLSQTGVANSTYVMLTYNMPKLSISR